MLLLIFRSGPSWELAKGAEFDSPILNSGVLEQDQVTDSGSGSPRSKELGGPRVDVPIRLETLVPLWVVPDEPEVRDPADAVPDGQEC